MKTSKKATSILEAMIVMLIIITGVIGMYNIYFASSRLSESTKNRVEAIEIAREGIEAIKNIRDTNWLLFGTDRDNCWNVLNYNSACVGADGNDITAGSYIIYPNSNNRWKIFKKNTGNYSESDYRDDFKVSKDDNGFYTQSGSSLNSIRPLFTREIKISYPGGDSNTSKMKVTSLVNWTDSSSDSVHKVQLDLELSNWEK